MTPDPGNRPRRYAERLSHETPILTEEAVLHGLWYRLFEQEGRPLPGLPVGEGEGNGAEAQPGEAG